MGNYFTSNKVSVENGIESIQNNTINEAKEEVAQSAPTPKNTEVETKGSISTIPEEVVEEINQYFKEDKCVETLVQKDASDNAVSQLTNLNEVTGIECEAAGEKNEFTQTDSETIANVHENVDVNPNADDDKNEIVVAEESDTENKDEEPVNKPTQLQLPTKKQKKKKHKQH